MNKQKPIIVIDSRERKPLKFTDKVETTTRKLETGDYTLEGFEYSLCIERKSLMDLFGSILTPRFQNVLARMEDYEFSVIVIEANYEDILHKKDWMLQKLKISSLAILGKIISIQTNHKIQVVMLGKSQTAHYVEHLCCYLYKKWNKDI